MPTVDRGTHTIHYDVRGHVDAPPVLLVMGLSFSSRAWHTLPERLSDSFRVITFDNSGSGRSTAPRKINIRQMADDAAAVLDANLIERASVFGISMGGMIAIELALRHPDRLRHLVLGATHGNYLKSRKPTLATVIRIGLAMMFQKRVSPRRFAQFLTSDAHYQRDAERFTAWLRETSSTTFINSMRQMWAIMGHAADKRLAEIRTPTLILTGDCDAMVPAENSRQLAQAIPGSRLIEFPGAGHCFPVEVEDQVVRLFEQFFGSTTGDQNVDPIRGDHRDSSISQERQR